MGNVQIITGNYKRRKIKTPGERTHPMGERERLALFNMISSYLLGATVVDAYAGSGALGIEALSRGAKSVIFIEKNPKAMQIIKENCAFLGIEKEKTVFYCGSVDMFCKKSSDAKKKDSAFNSLRKVGIILADPPYDRFNLEEVGSLIRFLAPKGILVLSHPDEAPVLAEMQLLKTQQYASAHLSIYKKD